MKLSLKKNVLLIMCDQLACTALSCYGSLLSTPNIDNLAKSSVVFEQAYCQTPLCSPSRASIVTGEYPLRHKVYSNVMKKDYPTVAAPSTEEGITNADDTTENVLHKSGYDTAHYGKWHISVIFLIAILICIESIMNM